jgi:hypothetical protein
MHASRTHKNHKTREKRCERFFGCWGNEKNPCMFGAASNRPGQVDIPKRHRMHAQTTTQAFTNKRAREKV